jgi:PAS domain S-box-containing protein
LLRRLNALPNPRSLDPRQLKRLLRRAILPPLLLLTLLAVVLLWQVNNLLDAHRAVEHSNRVIEHVDELTDQLLAMQSALRGYGVTGEPEMLDSYQRGLLGTESSYQRLLDDVNDNRAQRMRMLEVRPLLVRWQLFAEKARIRLQPIVNDAASGAAGDAGAGAAAGASATTMPASAAAVDSATASAMLRMTPGQLDFLFIGSGKQLMDELHAKLKGVLTEEQSIRDSRSLAVRRSAANTVIGGVILAMALGLVLAVVARRQMAAVGQTYDTALETARGRNSEVQRSEALLRLITNTLPSLVAFIDANQRYRFTNAAYETYRGVGNAQVHGRHVRDILGKETYDRVRPNIEKVLSGRHVVFDTTVNFPRAGQRDVHVEYMPHIDSAGKVGGFVALMTDITERNHAQRDLQRSEERYRTFVRQSSEGIWRFEISEPIPISAPLEQQIQMLYQHAYVAECNDAMAQMYGLDRADQIIGARLGDLMIRHDPTNVAYLKAFVHSGYRLADGESVERDKHGNVRYFVNNLVGFIEDGKLIRAWGTQRDVTDRKRAEEERDALLERERAARAEAERAGRTKDEFLSTLSHELRTPLNAILGWSQLLRRDEVNEADLQQGLETIERNSRTQAQLIDDLLDMSRIIAGKIRLDVQRVEVLGVIDAAIDTVRHAADAKDVQLYKHANAIAEVSVMGDPNRLQQMVWNLLSNAIKFTPNGGRVDVTLSRFGEQVEITVADSGIGIALDFLPHVFERFRQGDASTTRQHGGLGLGLSIVRQMVEMHGGTVHAHSDGPGHGATFRILLPVCPLRSDGSLETPDEYETPSRKVPRAGGAGEAGAAEAGRAAGVLDGNALSGVKILIADDEPDALEVLRRQLVECDAEVFTAATADDALKQLGHAHPHVLVSDIGMPEHDGYWLIQQIRLREVTSGVHLPAVALTAFARPEDRERALDAGYDHHLAKPVEAAELVTLVASLARPMSGSR